MLCVLSLYILGSLGRSQYDPRDLVSHFLNESCPISFSSLRGGLGRKYVRFTKEVQNVLFTYLTSWKTCCGWFCVCMCC